MVGLPRTRGLLLLLGFFHATAAAGEPVSAETVRTCVERNAPQSSLVHTLRLTARDHLGQETTSRAKLYWKRSPEGQSRLLVRLLEPAEVRGSTLLVEESSKGDRTVWVYLPEIGAVRKVGAARLQGALLNSDLTLQDLEYLVDIAAHTELRNTGEVEVAGRASWRLESCPEATTPCDRVVVFVDRTWCIPLRGEFYEGGGGMSREFAVSPEDAKQNGEYWTVRRFLVTDHKTGSTTEVVAESTEIDVPIAPSLLDIKTQRAIR